MESDIVDDLSEDLIRDVFTYLSTNKYPEASSSSRKRVIRKKALKFFISTNGELMYKQKLKGKVRINALLMYLELRGKPSMT